MAVTGVQEEECQTIWRGTEVNSTYGKIGAIGARGEARTPDP